MATNNDYVDQWKKDLANGKLFIKGNANLANLTLIGQAGPVVELNIENCRNITLQGIEELKDTLKILRIADCDLKTLEGIQGLAVIEELIVAGNQLSLLEPLEKITTLKKIDISNNKIESSLQLFFLMKCTQLDSFIAFGNKMTEEKEYEDRWMFAVPDAIHEVRAVEDKNTVDEWQTDIIESIKYGLDPFVEWRLSLRLKDLEKENADLDL